MNEHTMEVYVIANTPYPEKVSNSRYYINQTDAERDLQLMDERLQPYFKVYRAEITVYDK